MLATPHILAGAAVGKAVRTPWIALPVAVLSHFVLDFIPHLDVRGLFGGDSGFTSAEIVAAGIDVLAGVALVIWATGRQPRWKLIYAAAFAGLLIDVVFNSPIWGGWLGIWPGTAWLSIFHHDVQHNVPPTMWPLGFGTQAVVLTAAVVVLRRGSPTPTRG